MLDRKRKADVVGDIVFSNLTLARWRSATMAATSSAFRSKKDSTCRRDTMSACPRETGKASSIAKARSFESITRAAGIVQNGHLFFDEALIVGGDPGFAD